MFAGSGIRMHKYGLGDKEEAGTRLRVLIEEVPQTLSECVAGSPAQSPLGAANVIINWRDQQPADLHLPVEHERSDLVFNVHRRAGEAECLGERRATCRRVEELPQCSCRTVPAGQRFQVGRFMIFRLLTARPEAGKPDIGSVGFGPVA